MQPRNDAFFNARLLLAEDDPVNQDIATRILENMGCSIITASDGVTAAHLLSVESFDLALMDCEMPQLDGLEATRRVRHVEQTTLDSAGDKTRKRVPIVALTAHSLNDIREKCLAAGMDDILAKPFNKKQMAEKLQRWIGDLQRPASAKEQSDASGSDIVLQQLASDDLQIDRTVVDAFLTSRGAAGAALLNRLLLRFADIAPRYLASLWEHYEAGQSEEVWRIAHTLRSSAGALGARQVAHRCAAIERAVRENGLDGLEPTLQRLEGELAATLESLKRLTGEADERARKS